VKSLVEFNCPHCDNGIFTAFIPGQDIGHRIARPHPFSCPHCEQGVQFNPNVDNFMALGIVLAFAVSTAIWVFTSWDAFYGFIPFSLGWANILVGMYNQHLVPYPPKG